MQHLLLFLVGKFDCKAVPKIIPFTSQVSELGSDGALSPCLFAALLTYFLLQTLFLQSASFVPVELLKPFLFSCL
jgi:hypothetical protein